MEHTPWKVAKSAIVYTDTGPFLEDATGTTIGRIFSSDDFSVAESVVRAVNNHTQLLEALETLLMGYDSLGEHEPVSNLIAGARLAHAAIKEATK